MTPIGDRLPSPFGIKKHLAFTLLELLVALSILSIGAILTGVKVQQLYKEQRFLSDVERVIEHLHLAQELMMILDADVTLFLGKEEKSGLKGVWIEIEKPLDERWARFLERKIVLAGIGASSWNGEEREKIVLRFSLGAMSQGTLVLSEGKQGEGRSSSLFLPGYPAPLPCKNEGEREREELYPIQVRQELTVKRD